MRAEPLVAVGLLASLLACSGLPREPGERPGPELWVYVPGNLSLEENVRSATEVLREAASCGYTAVVLADSKFAFPDLMGPVYQRKVRRVVAAARSAGLEVIPAIADFGDGRALLTRDPNLAAGLPVREAPFRLKGTEARPDRRLYPRLRNGSFEESSAGRPAGWNVRGHDVVSLVRRDGDDRTALRFDAEAGFSRVSQSAELPPWQAFRIGIDLWARGELDPTTFVVGASVGERPLVFQHLVIDPDAVWHRYHVVFNSMEGGEVQIVLGTRRPFRGEFRADNVRLEPAGLLNVLRRPDTPLRVRGPRGRELVEGRDFEPVADPMLRELTRGRLLSLGHRAPAIRLLPPSGVGSGEELRVSYYHPIVVDRVRVPLSVCAPGIDALLKEQIRWMDALVAPRRALLWISEVRLAGYEPSCGRRASGELLREILLRVRALAQREGGFAVAVWSEMYDPLHNALGRYYLNRGGNLGSWEHLPEDVWIVNWNSPARRKSLLFFSSLGQTQIVSWNEADPRETIETAVRLGREVPGVRGFQYTTWRRDYSRMCALAEAALRGSPS